MNNSVLVRAQRGEKLIRRRLVDLHIATGISENQTGHTLRMLRRILGDYSPAETMTDDHKTAQAERLRYRFDIVSHGHRRVVAVLRRIGETHTAEIEGHRPARGAKMIELRTPLREIGPIAVDEENRNRSAAPAVVDVQPALRTADECRLFHVCTRCEKKDRQCSFHSVSASLSMRCRKSSRVATKRSYRVASSSSPK